MSRAWQNVSNNSSGFVYFNTNQQYQSSSLDTEDFLSFSDSPQVSPQSQRFTPNYYSSPLPKLPRRGPRSYPQDKRKFKRWSGNSSNWSHNSSNNSEYSPNSSWKDNETEDEDMRKFLHPSFLEDPWAKLEGHLNQQKQENSIEETSRI